MHSFQRDGFLKFGIFRDPENWSIILWNSKSIVSIWKALKQFRLWTFNSFLSHMTGNREIEYPAIVPTIEKNQTTLEFYRPRNCSGLPLKKISRQKKWTDDKYKHVEFSAFLLVLEIRNLFRVDDSLQFENRSEHFWQKFAMYLDVELEYYSRRWWGQKQKNLKRTQDNLTSFSESSRLPSNIVGSGPTNPCFRNSSYGSFSFL